MPSTPRDLIPEEFAGNEWLVEDLYERYRKDRDSVDRDWWPVFEAMDRAASSGRDSAAASPKPPAEATTNESAAQAEAPAKKPAPSSAAQHKGPSAAASKPAPQKTTNKSTQESTPVESTSAGSAEQPQDEPQDKVVKLRGPAKAVAANMEASLSVPTATTVRAVPAKLLIDNRIVINSHLARNRGGKVSFTHLIGYAVIKALKKMPSMNVTYEEQDGKPVAIHPAHVNFGLAIDLPNKDGSRNLVVPNIKGAEDLTFRQFWDAYEDMVGRARKGELTMDDYAGTTVSLTNPGGIGTTHSVPRLMSGQAAIIGVGALEYPAEFQGMSPERIAKDAVSKILTLTSTYDHRVIQGAASGEFLKLVHGYLNGEDGFYDEIFQSLRIPYEPVRWTPDIAAVHENDLSKDARVQALIQACLLYTSPSPRD